MILAFELSMPGRASWNGGWSGADRRYVRTRVIDHSRKAEDRARELIGSHGYHWEDGWSASVTVREVDRSEAAKLRAKSDGFCGYEWMIDSLMRCGEIRT